MKSRLKEKSAHISVIAKRSEVFLLSIVGKIPLFMWQRQISMKVLKKKSSGSRSACGRVTSYILHI